MNYDSFFLTNVPIWVSVLFLIVIPTPVVLIAKLAEKGHHKVNHTDSSNIYYVVLGFYMLYLGLVSLLCFMGYFEENTLPPRIIQFTTLPLLFFLMFVVFNLSITKNIIRAVDLADLVGIHVFRLIGSFFIILYLFDALPGTLALIAGTGDLITAISSIFIASSIRRRPEKMKTLVLLWNTFGLIDILMTSITAIVLTKVAIETGSQGPESLASFPFCFIPAFAPATIIFLHCCVYRKLWEGK